MSVAFGRMSYQLGSNLARLEEELSCFNKGDGEKILSELSLAEAKTLEDLEAIEIKVNAIFEAINSYKESLMREIKGIVAGAS
jgi:uncharacterized protein YaaN involved in tellurite resistance